MDGPILPTRAAHFTARSLEPSRPWRMTDSVADLAVYEIRRVELADGRRHVYVLVGEEEPLHAVIHALGVAQAFGRLR